MATPMPASVPAVPAAAPSQPCPICGVGLVPPVGAPHSAPWLCPNLVAHRNGFWQAELDNRAVYDPSTRCFAFRAVAKVQAQVDQEHAAARQRGTSARPDQLRLLSQQQLGQLAADRRVHPAMQTQTQTLIVGPGGS